MGMCPNMWGRVWHHTDHSAIQVDHSQVLQLFSGNFVITRFGCPASKAHHLIFRCYIINEHCDVICDIMAPHMHWSCDLLL